jgi:hypothetical protein
LGTAALSTGFAKDAAADVEWVAAVAASGTRSGDAFDGVGDCRTGSCGTGGVRSCSTCEDGGEGVAIAFGGARFNGFAALGPGDEAAVVSTAVAAAGAGVTAATSGCFSIEGRRASAFACMAAIERKSSAPAVAVNARG